MRTTVSAGTVTAADLQPGMTVTHPGWLNAHDRSKARYLIRKVIRREIRGGWKGGSMTSPWMDSVVIEAHIVRGEDRVPTRIVVPPGQVFHVEARA